MSEVCGVCKDLGLNNVIAHYSSVPAGKSGNGKAVPAKCYHHHFNMPLPPSLQAQITKPASATPKAEPEPQPFRAHATRRHPVADSEAPISPKTGDTAMPKPQRLCACSPDCKEIAKSNASPYARGHNPGRATSEPKTRKPYTRKTPIQPPPVTSPAKSVADLLQARIDKLQKALEIFKDPEMVEVCAEFLQQGVK